MALLRSKLSDIWRSWFQGKALMGVDIYSNKYYAWHQRDYKGNWEEKREVRLQRPPEHVSEYDPDAVPPEWRSWLSGHRLVAPSRADSERLQAYRESVRVKAAAIDLQQEQRRVTDGEADKNRHGVAKVLPPIGDAQYQAGPPRPTGNVHTVLNTEAVEDMAKTVQDSADGNEMAESRGHGDSFQPGEWRPQ